MNWQDPIIVNMAVDANKEIVIDNSFFVPLGVVDVRQQGLDDASSYYGSGNDAGGSDPGTPQDSVGGTPGQIIPIPTSFAVVDQQVRITKDGRAAVDVTLEFPDTMGIVRVDVRYTKADEAS